MANKQYTVSNSDRSNANAFTVPGDEDGGAGDDSFELDDDPRKMDSTGYVHINNGWDANVDVTLQGSHFADPDMSEAATDGSAVTVSSGGGTDFFHVDKNHSYIEVSVDPAADPTSGDLVVTFQTREA